MAKEYIRCRCPLCGMMPFVDQVDFEKPYELTVYRQTIGGSQPTLSIEEKQLPRRETKGRGRGRPPKVKKVRGLIHFESINSGVLFEEIEQKIKDKIEKLHTL